MIKKIIGAIGLVGGLGLALLFLTYYYTQDGEAPSPAPIPVAQPQGGGQPVLEPPRHSATPDSPPVVPTPTEPPAPHLHLQLLLNLHLRRRWLRFPSRSRPPKKKRSGPRPLRSPKRSTACWPANTVPMGRPKGGWSRSPNKNFRPSFVRTANTLKSGPAPLLLPRKPPGPKNPSRPL
jgi:hypothetical protein